MLTHRNLIANVQQLLAGTNPRLDLCAEDVVLGLLPMFHIYAITLVNLLSLRGGACVVTLPRYAEVVTLLPSLQYQGALVFDLHQYLGTLQDYKVTVAPIVPPIILAMAKLPLVDSFDLSSLRRVVSGAAPLGAELETAFRAKFPTVQLGQVGIGWVQLGQVGIEWVQLGQVGIEWVQLGQVGAARAGIFVSGAAQLGTELEAAFRVKFPTVQLGQVGMWQVGMGQVGMGQVGMGQVGMGQGYGMTEAFCTVSSSPRSSLPLVSGFPFTLSILSQSPLLPLRAMGYGMTEAFCTVSSSPRSSLPLVSGFPFTLSILSQSPLLPLRAMGYGMTEASPTVTASRLFARVPRPPAPGSCGSVLPLTEVKVVHMSTGELLPPNERGELWVRGPQVMKGDLNNPEATAATITPDDWLRTGDVAYVDWAEGDLIPLLILRSTFPLHPFAASSKGYLNNPEATAATITPDRWLRTGDVAFVDKMGEIFVVDRVKELIKVKGFQVPLAELEGLLIAHPDIADAAVVPAPSEESGEVPVAFVVLRQGGAKLSLNEVKDFISKQ
ncbi:unnamed protein product, partial [Closterium sp. Naga37s-1]